MIGSRRPVGDMAKFENFNQCAGSFMCSWTATWYPQALAKDSDLYGLVVRAVMFFHLKSCLFCIVVQLISLYFMFKYSSFFPLNGWRCGIPTGTGVCCTRLMFVQKELD